MMIRNKKAYIFAKSENKYGTFCAGSKWKKIIGFRWCRVELYIYYTHT